MCVCVCLCVRHVCVCVCPPARQHWLCQPASKHKINANLCTWNFCFIHFLRWMIVLYIYLLCFVMCFFYFLLFFFNSVCDLSKNWCLDRSCYNNDWFAFLKRIYLVCFFKYKAIVCYLKPMFFIDWITF